MKAPVIVSPVMGIQYRGVGIFKLITMLVPGDQMMVEREPNDSNAVKVSAVLDTEELVWLGYIAAPKAAIMAPFMDQGWMYTSKVSDAAVVRAKGSYMRIKLRSLVVVCYPIQPMSKRVTRKVEEHV